MTDDPTNVRSVDFARRMRPSNTPVKALPVTLLHADKNSHLNKRCSDVRGFSIGAKNTLKMLEYKGILYVGDLVQLSRNNLETLVKSQLGEIPEKPLNDQTLRLIGTNIDQIEQTLVTMRLHLGMSLSGWERPTSQEQSLRY